MKITSRTSTLVLLIIFAILWLGLRIPWISCDPGIPSMWEYGFNATDEGYYLVGGKEKLLWGTFTDLSRQEAVTYGYAPLMHFLSFAAHKVFGLSTWTWRIPFVTIGFLAWMTLFNIVRRKTTPFTAFLVCLAFSLVPMTIAYERTACNDVLVGSLLVFSCWAALGKGCWRLVLSSLFIGAITLVKPSVWALAPLTLACLLHEQKTRHYGLDVAIFVGGIAVFTFLFHGIAVLATLPDAAASGLSVSEIFARTTAHYGLPNVFALASHFKAASCFPRDPSSTMLGTVAVFLVPIPVYLSFRSRFRMFALFVPAYVAAISVMNTIYTHYFIPVMMILPILWAYAQPAKEEEQQRQESAAAEPLSRVLLAGALVAVAAFFAYWLIADAIFDPRLLSSVYSRIYNLPQANVWTVSAAPAIGFIAFTVGAALAFGLGKTTKTKTIALLLAAAAAGSVAFALLPAAKLAPALKVNSDKFLFPLVLNLAFGAFVLISAFAFPVRLRQAWTVLPILAVALSYALTPTWRSAAVELVLPGTHYHRDAAEAMRKILPDDAIVLGERSDQMLMSLPIMTASTILSNSDPMPTIDLILAKRPNAKLFALIDLQQSYNLQHYREHPERVMLEQLAAYPMPSFGDGKPMPVYLCRIHLKANQK